MDDVERDALRSLTRATLINSVAICGLVVAVVALALFK